MYWYTPRSCGLRQAPDPVRCPRLLFGVFSIYTSYVYSILLFWVVVCRSNAHFFGERYYSYEYAPTSYYYYYNNDLKCRKGKACTSPTAHALRYNQVVRATSETTRASKVGSA